jgi:cytoskeletal protein CcmA (bactofilin family)
MRMRGFVASVALVALVATAGAQSPSSSADTQLTRPDNYYAAGNRIDISTPMPADVVVAGRRIEMAETISGDILAAGWRVSLTGSAEDDVRIAGSEVEVNAPVRGDLTAAGGEVIIGPKTRVSGRSWLTGGRIRIEGRLDRDLHVAGADVQLAGEIHQPVEVIAEKLEVLPSARLHGGLTYKGPVDARIADGAVINGPVTFERIPAREAREARAFPAISSLLFAIHLFLAGLLVIAFLPRAEASIVQTLRRQPGKSLLAGFVLLVTVPSASILLIVSVLGLPIGLTMAALYAVGLFAGVLTTAFFVGEAEAQFMKWPAATRGQHVLLLLAGVLTLALLRLLLGGVVVFVSVIFGFGALGLWLYQTYAPTTAAPASA